MAAQESPAARAEEVRPDSRPALPLPMRRCLTKEQAADYLAIGVTLLLEIGPRPIKFGRRSVWDLVSRANRLVRF
jgi:hypothetical protein